MTFFTKNAVSESYPLRIVCIVALAKLLGAFQNISSLTEQSVQAGYTNDSLPATTTQKLTSEEAWSNAKFNDTLSSGWNGSDVKYTKYTASPKVPGVTCCCPM